MATLRSESTSSLSVYSSLESHKHLTPDPHKGPQPLRPIPHPGQPVVSLLPDGDTPPTFCFTQQATRSSRRGPHLISLPFAFLSISHHPSPSLAASRPAVRGLMYSVTSHCHAPLCAMNRNGHLSCRPAFGFPPSVSFLLCPSWITPPHSPRCSLRVVGRNVPGLWPRLRLCPPISTR
jgi:hypothetical protein